MPITRPPLASLTRRAHASAGFTLIETIIVIVILGIISTYAMPNFSTGKLTLDAQARTLASDLQRAQLLATTTGQAYYFCPFRDGYVIKNSSTCPTSLPDQTSSVTQSVVVTLDKQATLSATPATTLSFNSLGQPNAASRLQLLSAPTGSGSITVTVAAVTGLVSMASP